VYDTINDELCIGDSILILGSYVDATGTYYDTLYTTKGCDSTYITYEVSVKDSALLESDTIVLQDGDGIMVDGTWRTTSGTFTDTIPYLTGCDSLITDTVLVFYSGPPASEEFLIIPNVFTPNDDNNNDEFMITQVIGLIDIQMTLYNRWGSQVYAAKNEKPWNGDIGGKPALEGTYYAVIIALNQAGEEREFRGHFSLIRKEMK